MTVKPHESVKHQVLPFSGTDLGGSKALKEPPGLHRGFLEPPVGLVWKNFKMLLLSNEVAATYFYNYLQISEIVSSVRKIIKVGIQVLQINRNLKYKVC